MENGSACVLYGQTGPTTLGTTVESKMMITDSDQRQDDRVNHRLQQTGAPAAGAVPV